MVSSAIGLSKAGSGRAFVKRWPLLSTLKGSGRLQATYACALMDIKDPARLWQSFKLATVRANKVAVLPHSLAAQLTISAPEKYRLNLARNRKNH